MVHTQIHGSLLFGDWFFSTWMRAFKTKSKAGVLSKKSGSSNGLDEPHKIILPATTKKIAAKS